MAISETLTPFCVLSNADTSIKAAVLPFTYAGMHLLYQSKFTMRRPITTNILLPSISGYAEILRNSKSNDSSCLKSSDFIYMAAIFTSVPQ